MLEFGVSAWSANSGSSWREAARRYEGSGYDTLWVADHVSMVDPFTALVAAGAATQQMRLGPMCSTSSSGIRCEGAIVEHLARLQEMGVAGVTVFARDGNADALTPLLARLR